MPEQGDQHAEALYAMSLVGQQQTAERELGGLPTFFPDETLFSWAARYHRLGGFPRAQDTSRILFGDARAGLRHDFPSGIDHLCRATSNALGTFEQVILDRTLLPYYFPLLTDSICRNALNGLRSRHIGSLKYQLGLLTSRFRAHHPLKACPACMDYDLHTHGVAYWHRTHQWPGAWVCLHHNLLLGVGIEKVNGIQRFQYLLPDETHLVAPVGDSDIELGLPIDQLARLATLANSWATEVAFRNVGGHDLRAAYRQALQARGWMTPSGSIRLRAAAAAYVVHLDGLVGVPELAALPGSASQAASQLTRLLGRPRTGTHPIRHLSMIEWLFDSWRSFTDTLAEVYQRAESEPRETTSISVPQAQSDAQARMLLEEVQNRGTALSTAARKLGIDVSTAQAIVAAAGMTLNRRPKKLDADTLHAVLKNLTAGVDKQQVADRHGLTITTVNRLLRTHPDIKEQWQIARFHRARADRRQTWKHLLRTYPRLGIKYIRSLSPATYAWLYRHDRAWLERLNNRVPRIRQGNNAHIRWSERDRTLAAKVVEATQTLHAQRPGSSIELWQLCAEIPELRARLARSDALPLTLKAIDHAKNAKPAQSSTAHLI